MKTLTFDITINASPEKVWNSLWEDANYRKWTSAFSAGSYALSSWKEGARVHFMSPSGDGIFSEIKKLVPNEYMAFHHLGMMKGGKEQPATDESKEWEGAMETYTLKKEGDSTQLRVTVDTVEEYAGHFTDSFPKALNILKSIAEG